MLRLNRVATVDKARRMRWKHFLALSRSELDLQMRLRGQANGAGGCIRAAQSRVDRVGVDTVP